MTKITSIGVVILLLVCLLKNNANAQTVQWVGNGHYYEMVFDSTVNWQEARVFAESMGGYLATITSAEENLWISNTFGDVNAMFIGGFQPIGTSEPDGGWAWITGEEWGFTNWGSGEPNNSLVGEEEDVLEFGWYGLNSNGEQWNDMRDSWTRGGYIVEYGDPFAPILPEPLSSLLFAVGVAVFAFRRFLIRTS